MIILYHDKTLNAFDVDKIIINIAESKRFSYLKRLSAEQQFEKAIAEINCVKMTCLNNNTNYLGDNKYLMPSKYEEAILINCNNKFLKEKFSVSLACNNINSNDYINIKDSININKCLESMHLLFGKDPIFNSFYEKSFKNFDIYDVNKNITLNTPVSLLLTFKINQIIEDFIETINNIKDIEKEKKLFNYKCLLIDISRDNVFDKVNNSCCKKIIISPNIISVKYDNHSINTLSNIDEINDIIKKEIKELKF